MRANRVKVAGLAVVALVAGAFIVLARLEHHRAFQKTLARQGKDIVYDAFGAPLATAVAHLGAPYRWENLRENEQLIYWHFDPVILQIHFHNGRALRMAYFTDSASARDKLTREIIEEFGGEGSWERRALKIDGEKKRVMINPRNRLSLVIEHNAVLVYGYILK